MFSDFINYGGLEEEDEKYEDYISKRITQYKYRQLFGLSYQEYLKEPYDILLDNLLIDQVVKKK